MIWKNEIIELYYEYELEIIHDDDSRHWKMERWKILFLELWIYHVMIY